MTFSNNRPTASENATHAATDRVISGTNLSLAQIPLLENESAEDLDGFVTAAMDAIKPRDAIEAIWLQDFISYAWESLRLRRLKTDVVIQERARVLHNTLVMRVKPETTPPDVTVLGEAGAVLAHSASDHFDALEDLTRKWARGDTDAITEVSKLLANIGLDMDDILSSTFECKLDTIARIDKLIGHYDQRRDSAVKELEKRRDTLARRAYVFSQTFSDVSFDEDERD